MQKPCEEDLIKLKQSNWKVAALFSNFGGWEKLPKNIKLLVIEELNPLTSIKREIRKEINNETEI